MKRYIVLFLYLFSCMISNAQFYGVKSNSVAWATGTINAGVELAIEKQWSVDISFYLNPIKAENLKTAFFLFQPAARYWLYEHFVGHFVAAHPAYGTYDIGNDRWHYKGWVTGVGFSYGYTWIVSDRWNLTAETGIGLYYLRDKKRIYEQDIWTDEITRHAKRMVVAPSKIEVAVTYLF